MTSRTDQTTCRGHRAPEGRTWPRTLRASGAAFLLTLIAAPMLGAMPSAWARQATEKAVDDAPRGGEPQRGSPSTGDDDSSQGRRDRGGRGMMPLPPDWPRAGGFGTRERGLIEGLVAGEMAGADLSRREITDAELARAIKLAGRVSEEWGRTLAARAEQDPAQMKAALRTTGRRLFALLMLEERAPKLFESKIAELRAQGETTRAAEALKRAQEERSRAGDAADTAAASKDDPALMPLRAALDAAIARQIEATLAVRREELVAIEARIAEMRGAIDRDAADSAALAEEIRTRALAPRQTDARQPDARQPDGRQPDGRQPSARDGDDRRGPREGGRGPRDEQGGARGDGAPPPANPSTGN